MTTSAVRARSSESSQLITTIDDFPWVRNSKRALSPGSADRRNVAPSGGSPMKTAAPASTNIFVAYAPEIPSDRSTTTIVSRGLFNGSIGPR